jgi:hypothetical protein
MHTDTAAPTTPSIECSRIFTWERMAIAGLVAGMAFITVAAIALSRKSFTESRFDLPAQENLALAPSEPLPERGPSPLPPPSLEPDITPMPEMTVPASPSLEKPAAPDIAPRADGSAQPSIARVPPRPVRVPPAHAAPGGKDG